MIDNFIYISYITLIIYTRRIRRGVLGLRDAHVLTKLFRYEEIADMIGGKPVQASDGSLSQVSVLFNLLVAFSTSMEEKERCYSFISTRIPTT
jgi:hypothetical protein